MIVDYICPQCRSEREEQEDAVMVICYCCQSIMEVKV